MFSNPSDTKYHKYYLFIRFCKITVPNVIGNLNVCKCISVLGHGGTLNSRQAGSPLMRLVEGEERWEAPDHSQGVLSLNWGKNESNRTVTCMVLKATTNDRRTI
ncbi:uncharacterized protein TNCV_1934991 [Trichonephila clavipes]|nr:uncharacterized protein TNCV_1934991 [Trichonephila clavipes]